LAWTSPPFASLTLNVLLSFAQFEREVTSERIRDKISNEAEADRVRMIFRSYLKLGSLNLLMADLRKQGIVTKVRTLKTGATVGYRDKGHVVLVE
jgi:DNA invertase Pin-like site-specific DNA recombinase